MVDDDARVSDEDRYLLLATMELVRRCRDRISTCYPFSTIVSSMVLYDSTVAEVK